MDVFDGWVRGRHRIPFTLVRSEGQRFFMPYIKKEQRERLARGEKPQDAGELNYTITTLLLDYIGRKGPSYAHFNEIMGVLGCVTQEFYRRWAVPYEETKIQENGDLPLPPSLSK